MLSASVTTLAGPPIRVLVLIVRILVSGCSVMTAGPGMAAVPSSVIIIVMITLAVAGISPTTTMTSTVLVPGIGGSVVAAPAGATMIGMVARGCRIGLVVAVAPVVLGLGMMLAGPLVGLSIDPGTQRGGLVPSWSVGSLHPLVLALASGQSIEAQH